MRKAYKYRLYPNRKQEQALTTMVETHRHLYNRALAERKNAYEQEHRSVTYQEQSAHLKEERLTNPYLQATNFSSCQATLKRLQRAFLSILSSKVAEADCQVIAVPPHNTTQRCSACGQLPEVKKTLADRVHVCPFCGYTADRDVNAAQNILALGRSVQASSTPLGMLA